jgi:hypothetical protein
LIVVPRFNLAVAYGQKLNSNHVTVELWNWAKCYLECSSNLYICSVRNDYCYFRLNKETRRFLSLLTKVQVRLDNFLWFPVVSNWIFT